MQIKAIITPGKKTRLANAYPYGSFKFACNPSDTDTTYYTLASVLIIKKRDLKDFLSAPLDTVETLLCYLEDNGFIKSWIIVKQ